MPSLRDFHHSLHPLLRKISARSIALSSNTVYAHYSGAYTSADTEQKRERDFSLLRLGSLLRRSRLPGVRLFVQTGNEFVGIDEVLQRAEPRQFSYGFLHFLSPRYHDITRPIERIYLKINPGIYKFRVKDLMIELGPLLEGMGPDSLTGFSAIKFASESTATRHDTAVAYFANRTASANFAKTIHYTGLRQHLLKGTPAGVNELTTMPGLGFADEPLTQSSTSYGSLLAKAIAKGHNEALRQGITLRGNSDAYYGYILDAFTRYRISPTRPFFRPGAS